MTPDPCVAQVDPSIVATIVPPAPTDLQTRVEVQLMPNRWLVVLEVCAVQLVPPLTVFQIAPRAPTAKHVELLGQLMSARK
jgi:hypothetical protein